MRGETFHLHKWSVTERPDPYLAPEVSRKCLFGFRDNEEKSVVTSRIIKVEGRTVTTSSGTVYILEDIDPSYLQWMKDNGFQYNPEQPLTIKEI